MLVINAPPYPSSSTALERSQAENEELAIRLEMNLKIMRVVESVVAMIVTMTTGGLRFSARHSSADFVVIIVTMVAMPRRSQLFSPYESRSKDDEARGLFTGATARACENQVNRKRRGKAGKERETACDDTHSILSGRFPGSICFVSTIPRELFSLQGTTATAARRQATRVRRTRSPCRTKHQSTRDIPDSARFMLLGSGRLWRPYRHCPRR